MRLILGILFILFCLTPKLSLAESSGNSNDVSSIISSYFDPFDNSHENAESESSLGTTIRTRYAGTGYFFGDGEIWNATSQIASIPDSVGSFVGLFPFDTSRYLFARDFGLDIPCNATITELKFHITRQNTTTVDIEDALVSIYNPNTLKVGSVNMKNPAIWIEGGTDWETITYTHANWGETLTPELLNDPRFGLVLQVRQLLTAGLAQGVVDAIQLEVCYNVGTTFYRSDNLHYR